MEASPPANAILAALQWDPAAGSLAYNGVRYLLVRPETVIEFQRAVEAHAGAEAAGELLYAGGFAGGQLSGRRYREEFKLSEAEAVTFMCRMGGEIGWGAFELLRLDLPAGRLEVAVRASPFAQAYARSPDGRPVCHLIRGVLGGLLSGLLARPVRARETGCAAAGAPACRFVVEASS
jgi:predicted hydrocarbon binding protein